MFTWGRINSLFGHQQGFIRGFMFTWGRINSLFGHQQGFIRGLHVYMGKDKFIVRSSTRFYKRFTCLHGEG